ncbi:extracellular solute-binding protein [Rhizobium halophytocola]|uniref:Microcin C transport system substrate-binding protein n=1 Tax=Rhizobium halophytocola TaxID=735519 RepID=A0ABS4E197_9HYPH|nr:extracellular solute-binding protein [Rhizobium halophytocola]MBP1851712.1 microcin C transport system substrate-binding protein [Rhizobium halophytocola]
MRFATRLVLCLVTSLAAGLGPVLPAAGQEPVFHHGIALDHALKYPVGFKQFDYVNPDAPKGGTLRLTSTGTFDTFNPILDKGELAPGLTYGRSYVFETLMQQSEDEINTSYGLLAEGVSFPKDISSATFRLRKEARFADGTPVTPEDVIFSFEKIKDLQPLFTAYYSHVKSAEKTGERDVTFHFDQTGNRELPAIVGEFAVVSRKWWEGKDANGNQRDIARTTLEPVMGSGPYKIADFRAGATVRYELRDDYWGKDLNLNVGTHNFKAVDYTMYGDRDVEFDAFRGGNSDFRVETQAARWATQYDFPAIQDGRVIKEEVKGPLRATGIMQGLFPNMRRDLFKDERVREALNYALDFEMLNKTVFYGAYKRIDSYFWNTELASSGLPSGKELDILNTVKDKVPPDVFTTPYTNPVGGTPQAERENLRKAIQLLKQAGYEIRGTQMVNAKTGKPLSFELLLSSSALEVVALPYRQILRKIGIDMSVRTVDAAQYQNRIRSFDYDMTWMVVAQTLSPGNEQRDMWGSQAAGREGSKNYAGISDSGVDALVDKVIFATDRDELVAATHALDRVLLAHHYVIPLYYSDTSRIAYSSTLHHPAELPKYGTGFPDTWWYAPSR